MVGLQSQLDLWKFLFLFVSLVVLMTMHVKQEGVSFSPLYLPLFVCIYTDRITSLKMFGSTSLSTPPKQFLCYGFQKFPLSGEKKKKKINKSTQLLWRESYSFVVTQIQNSAVALSFICWFQRIWQNLSKGALLCTGRQASLGMEGLSQSLPYNLVLWDCLTSSHWQKKQPLYKVRTAHSPLFFHFWMKPKSRANIAMWW